MANLQVKDGAEATKYLKASGAGTDGDPHVVEHLDTNSAAMLTALQAIQTAVQILDNIVSGSEAQADIVTMPATAAEGAALPSLYMVVAGDDGTDVIPLQLTATGDLKVTLDSEAVTLGGNLPDTSSGDLAAIATGVTDAHYADDAPFTAGSSQVIGIGAIVDDAAPNSVSEGGVGVPRISTRRELYVQLRDAAGNERGLNIDANGDVGVNERGLNIDANGDVGVTLPGTAETDIGAIKTAVEILDNIVSDSEAQVDVVAALPAGTNTIGKTQPFAGVQELGITELIGINEQVDQNDYSGSVGVALGGTYSGELLSFMLLSTEDGTGVVLEPTGQLFIFDADPTITSGDTTITAAERATVIGVVDVAAEDWKQSDNNGATGMILTDPIPFHGVSTLYFSFFNTLATSYNDAAGDDEQLEFNAWYRRDS